MSKVIDQPVIRRLSTRLAPAIGAVSPGTERLPAAAVGPEEPWRPRLKVVLAIAFALTSFQLLAAMAASRQWPLRQFYLSLQHWDGDHYRDIAELGYPRLAPTDIRWPNHYLVGFFPGYPLFVRLVAKTFHESMRDAMMSVSHLARFGFWTYFLLILARWKLSSRRVAFVVLLAAIHPASFFLAAGYSESLFYGALFGFVYWTTNDLRRWRWPLALAHGLVMSITRLPGAVACFCPVVACAAAVALAWRFGASDGVSWRSLASRVPRLALLGLAGSMGALAFLAWCQWTFGEWDIYLQSQRIVWHVYPDWWWWARWSNYNFWSATREWPDNVSRFCVLFTMLVAPVVAWREWSRLRTDQHGLSARLVLYLLAGALFTIHALGVSPIQMTSMLRYCLGPHLLLLLAAAHSGRDASTPWIGSRLGRMSVAAAVVALIVLQLTLASRFTHCLWVA